MPPKVKISKENIIEAAIRLIRNEGAEAINARTLAASLNCSTQPIFSNFATMEELQKEVLIAAHTMYLNFLKREAESEKYPKYKSFGMAYIRFAKEEKELFKLLFMCDRKGDPLPATDDFDASVDIIMNSTGLSMERAKLMHLETWTSVHGIATMFATSFLELEWDLVDRMLSDVYLGIRARHLSEEA